MSRAISFNCILAMSEKIKKAYSYIRINRYVKNKWLLWPIRFVIAVLIYFLVLESNFLFLTGNMPSLDEVQHPQVAEASELYSADSVLICKYYHENRTPISIDSVSSFLITALVNTEDVRFYRHHGLDLYALTAGLFSSIKGDQRGASTITQQLAKNLFDTRKGENQGLLQHIPIIRTVIYKSKEWLMAIKLEFYFSKKEILAMYFNTVEFGNNWFGIKVAANNYFNKSPSQLTVDEAALLVGILKATTSYNPLKNKARARERRNIVLGQLHKYHVINQQSFDSLKNLPIKLRLGQRDHPANNDSYLRTYLGKQLVPWCEKNNINLYEDGIKIYTTIDSRLQQFAEEAVHSHLKKVQKEFYSQWNDRKPWCDENGNEIPGFLNANIKNSSAYTDLQHLYKGNKDSIEKYLNIKKSMKVFTWDGPKDTLFSSYDSLAYFSSIYQAGMMCMDFTTGRVLVYVGGIDHNFYKYDNVTQTKRQAGSTFKPFAYLAAIDKGYDPCDTYDDIPVTIIDDVGTPWKPQNSSGGFSYRRKTLRRAMAQSCNSVTAQLTKAVGWHTVAEYAHKAGITSPLMEVPSISLGSNDVGVFEMVRGYGTIMNNGTKTEPYLIETITDKNKKKIAVFTSKKQKVISDETSWLMRYMFLGALQEPGGTSFALFNFKLFDNANELGGKTGTTSNYSDAWYMGLCKNLVTGVWTGTSFRAIHLRGGNGQGSRMALPIFGKFMERAIETKNPNVQIGQWPKPPIGMKRNYNNCWLYQPANDSIEGIDSLKIETPDSLKIQQLDSLIND